MSVIFLFHLIVKSEHVAPFLFHSFFRNACGSSASAIFFVLLFAEAPQTPNFLFCYLRKLLKRQFFCFAICGSSASTNFFVLLFAEAPQAPNFLFCPLRKLRKHHFFCFHLCGTATCVGMVGAVPACPPERPRSGVPIPKTHALCAGMNDGCALTGRHGRAHRHRPYPSP